MKSFWILLFGFSLLVTCHSPRQTENEVAKEACTEASFDFETSTVDFTIRDSTGISLTFFKHKDSSYYHSLKYSTSEDQTQFKQTLANFEKLWIAAQSEIDIRLTSLNVGYPVQYDDLLSQHIKVFSSSRSWETGGDEKIDYRSIEETIMSSRVYPVNELLASFGYQVSGINIEKVGFVTSEKLAQLGFDPSLKVPVPYMVWIRVEEI